MCGIAGILRYDDALIDRDELQRMATWLTHRGPDDANTHVHGRCGLAHTRLSIIDLSDGVQPMHAPAHGSHGPLTVIFNGEIYNHRKLRHDLSGRGHVFTTNHSDTEVLLHGYRQWGRDLPSKLSGMFAFAIWNEDEQTLFLARDRVGKKPLFYSDDGVKLTFASEIGPIVASMRDRQVNHSALNRYLRFGYCGYESLAAGVMELAPAHWMEIAAGRRTKSEQYWSAASAAESSDGDSIEQVLQQAVSSRLEADVPLGCFLSGGIDSSLVAALAQQSLKQQGNDTLKTFSVRMPVSSYDESEAAAAVARHISSEHVQLEASADADIIDDLVRMTSVYGEPTADSSILPTFWLSRATRPHVKAVLSGDGGDELFGGYDRYRALRILAQHRWWVKCLPTWLLRSTNPKSKRARLRRLAQSAQHATPPDQYQSMIHLFTDKQIEQLLLYERSNEKITVADKWPDEADNRRAAMQWDFAHYLPMEVLRKVDRASHGGRPGGALSVAG